MPDPNLRAADADRQAVATVLGQALSDGRLTVEEYDERLSKAFAAKTYGELSQLTTDLPPSAALRRPAAAAQPARASACGPAPWMAGRRAMWAPWLTTAIIVTAIWLATSLGNGRPDYFWPIWVILPWGAVLLARTLTGGPARGPHHHGGRQHRDRYRPDR
jgi:hypothetical protein